MEKLSCHAMVRRRTTLTFPQKLTGFEKYFELQLWTSKKKVGTKVSIQEEFKRKKKIFILQYTTKKSIIFIIIDKIDRRKYGLLL